MASVVSRSAEGIIYSAPETLDVPNLDILTLLFGQWTNRYNKSILWGEH